MTTSATTTQRNTRVVKRAERKLITGTFPNYKINFPVHNKKDQYNYSALKMQYVHADIYSESNQINHQLLF